MTGMFVFVFMPGFLLVRMPVAVFVCLWVPMVIVVLMFQLVCRDNPSRIGAWVFAGRA
jgi:hypothetical protein